MLIYRILLILPLLLISLFGCSKNNSIQQAETITVNGTDLHVKIIGTGEPLFILHGGPGFSHDYFLPHLEPLSDDLKLVLFDQRGTGRSSVDLDSTSFSLDLLIEDIEALRQKLEFDKIHLMGHSWGGILAMHYAINYPESLSSLILCNSMPATPEFDDLLGENFARIYERQNMADLEPLQKEIEAGNHDITIQERLIQLHFRPSFYDTSDVNKLHLNLSENFFKTQELLPFLAPHKEPTPLLPQLENLHIPVLIIRGEIEAIPIEADRKLEETFPDARLGIISQSGHFPFIEKPEEFMNLISEFIKGDT